MNETLSVSIVLPYDKNKTSSGTISVKHYSKPKFEFPLIETCDNCRTQLEINLLKSKTE
jgi:hypothetical protein